MEDWGLKEDSNKRLSLFMCTARLPELSSSCGNSMIGFWNQSKVITGCGAMARIMLQMGLLKDITILNIIVVFIFGWYF